MSGSALAIALLLALAGPGQPEIPADAIAPDGLAELVRLAQEFPDDPDLAWALIAELRRRGELERAAARLQDFLERFPDLRPVAATLLGGVLHGLGRYEEALAVLERAVATDPTDAAAHLYRGLALRDLGRLEESEQVLELAARLDPELEGESLLLRALGRLDRGDEGRGRALLREVIDLAPSHETAKQAELLLGSVEAKAAGRRRLGLLAYLGAEHDSNVTLEGDVTPGGVASEESDFRLIWGAGLTYRALENESARLLLGYRYAESAHRELRAYDLEGHLLFASASLAPWRHATLRLDALASDTQLDDDRYLRRWSLRPAVLLPLSEQVGVSRLYFEVERTRYHDPPLLPSLERGGTTYAVGLEHQAPVGGAKRAWALLGAGLSRLDTDASRDLLGYEGDYDHTRSEGRLRIRWALPWELETDVRATVAWERYANRNLIGELLGGRGSRRDRIFEASVVLSRPLGAGTSVELRWMRTRQRSNLDLYTYDRHITGLYFRAETF